MNNCTYQTSLALKEAGLPQPTPAPGQFWYGPKRGILWLVLTDKHGPLFTQIGTTDHINEYFDAMVGFVFAPDLEYITALLPPGFILEMWDGRHSCKVEAYEASIRTMADNFTEAAALVYMTLKQNAPTSDFSKMGDVAQE